MLRASIHKHTLIFKDPAGTSRGVLYKKPVWYLLLHHTRNKGITGIGECGTIPGLSADDRPDLEQRLERLCSDINRNGTTDSTGLTEWPSIRFALETALTDLNGGGRRLLYESPFTEGKAPVPINGLVWMGDEEFMARQVDEKLDKGFRVIKLKVGAIDFNRELEIIRTIRKRFSENQITIRLDANGAFSAEEAANKLQRLAEFGIHSIEQPIKAGNPDIMARICLTSPIPVALDEELIGIHTFEERIKILDEIRPRYIILKPGLLGGFASAGEWIKLAEDRDIGWWITSALESNIGLNAIAQWTATMNNPLPQGLGTGALYTNNIPSPLTVSNGNLWYHPEREWQPESVGIKLPGEEGAQKTSG
ncbi:MAG TPA: o-succinylbenzoate synthase [Lentimicrobium sp.]|nr:o-succinylbenzoate synthase [Lentimicrobium sp.]